MGSKGATHKEATMTRDTAYLEQRFHQIYGHREAMLNEHSLEDVVIQSASNPLTCSGMLRPSSTVKSGDYLAFEGKTWIVRGINTLRLSPVAELYLCNQSFKLAGVENPILCYFNSATSTGQSLTTADKFYELDSKVTLYVQLNELTKCLTTGYRLIINRRVYKITGINDSTYPSLLMVGCELTDKLEMDNIEEGLAYNGDTVPSTPMDLNIFGEEKVKCGSIHRYELSQAVEGEWMVDNPKLAILTIVAPHMVEVEFLNKSDWVELTFIPSDSSNPVVKDILIY